MENITEDTTEDTTEENKTTEELDPDLQKLLNWVSGDSFNKTTVEYMLANIYSIPGGLPYHDSWDIPKQLDMAKLVYDIMATSEYLIEVWPSLRIVMGTNAGNTTWTAGVAVLMALQDAIRLLPLNQLAKRH